MNTDKNCTKMVMASFLRSTDGQVSWHFITADEVPLWIKENDTLMKEIIENEAMASNPSGGDDNWYMAIVPNKKDRQVVIH